MSDLLQKVACAVLSVRNFWTDSSRISANTLGSFSSEVREKLELELLEQLTVGIEGVTTQAKACDAHCYEIPKI